VRRRAHGFVLMLALFMIVSLAAIGVYLLTVATAQLEAGIQDEQGARAYQAARAGLDWGAYQVLRNPAFATACAGALQTENRAYINGLAGFHAVITCQSAGTETEAGASVRMFRITSKGCNQAGCPAASLPTHVERELQLTLAN
jgi:MSHA biogenesis protein MshP